MKKDKQFYINMGTFFMAKNPLNKGMSINNETTFRRLVKILGREIPPTFAELEAAAEGHKGGDKKRPHPYQFIIHCIQKGWIQPVG